MDQWIPDKDFIAADVVRWSEGVWMPRRRGKDLCVGELLISAEVIDRGKDGWVRLLVRACLVTKDEYAGRRIPVMKPGTLLRRSLRKILRGKPHRLPWTDESARDAVMRKPVYSRFVRQEENSE